MGLPTLTHLGSRLSRLSSEGFKTHAHSFSGVRVSGAVWSACCTAAATAANLHSRFVCIVNPFYLFPADRFTVYNMSTLTRA